MVGSIPISAIVSEKNEYDESDSLQLSQKIRQLAQERNTIILAHNYQLPQVQNCADYVGDSLALARACIDAECDTIIFCGVRFMAETAKIINPHKTVILPHKYAGCSLADSITVPQLLEWKRQYPEALVVAYVNTTAEIKAHVDICCTSSNAVEVVESLDQAREILFLPDQFLGQYVKNRTGRTNMHIWAGECHVHAGIHPHQIEHMQEQYPQSTLFIHPECGCSTSTLYLQSENMLGDQEVKFLSTGAMLEQAAYVTTPTVLVATEIGIIYQLQRTYPNINFIPVNSQASCSYMKMITLQLVWDALNQQGNMYETIDISPSISASARRSVAAMIHIGSPGSGE